MLTYERSPGDGALRENITRVLITDKLATLLICKEYFPYLQFYISSSPQNDKKYIPQDSKAEILLL